MKKGLYIVATPIGNLGDVSARAVEVLKECETIACEDTRVTKKLFSLIGISLKKKFIPLHDHNEEEQIRAISAEIADGRSVALVSDAGSPLISDPGYKLVSSLKKENIDIFSIPGPCAVVCALQLSGLPTNSFMFAGFVPNKDKARKDFFEKLKPIDSTLVFYETAPRILKTLVAAKEIFPNRKASVARELTKLYEECLTGSFDELIDFFSQKEPKGEMVFMLSPLLEKEKKDPTDLLRKKMKELSLKEAVQETVKETGCPKNEVYDLALRIKNEQ